MAAYSVPIIYRGLSHYTVVANSPAEAAEIAAARFNEGFVADECGNEWESIEEVLDPEEIA